MNSPPLVTLSVSQSVRPPQSAPCNFQSLRLYLWKDWEDYDRKLQDWIIGNGSAVAERTFLYDYELEWGKWHRSKERKCCANPFGSYMLNKKWTLEEEFNNHILRFQQVNVTVIDLNSYNIIILGWSFGY